MTDQPVTLAQFVERRIDQIFDDLAEQLPVGDGEGEFGPGPVAWELTEANMYLRQCWREWLEKQELGE